MMNKKNYDVQTDGKRLAEMRRNFVKAPAKKKLMPLLELLGKAELLVYVDAKLDEEKGMVAVKPLTLISKSDGKGYMAVFSTEDALPADVELPDRGPDWETYIMKMPLENCLEGARGNEELCGLVLDGFSEYPMELPFYLVDQIAGLAADQAGLPS